jgi:protein-L-isoaspartate(D-aspartate) O-methyltransferase
MDKESLIKYWKYNFKFSKKVIDAFRKVPRENFVLPEYKEFAYDDNPLPILKGQTISQPTTVMIMTDALEVKEGQKILEIGSGSGYQSAILSVLVGEKGKVYTTEIIPELAEFAKKNLKDYKNVKVIKAKGVGYKKEAPYDRIIVTAAAREIPFKLLEEQLKDSGIMIVPVGPPYLQRLLKIRKLKKIKIEDLGDFMFVPLRHG